jgi:hypothetical protein
MVLQQENAYEIISCPEDQPENNYLWVEGHPDIMQKYAWNAAGIYAERFQRIFSGRRAVKIKHNLHPGKSLMQNEISK